MKATAGSLSSLFLGVSVLTLGNGLFSIALGLRMTAFGYSATETGLVIGAYFAGFIPATLLAPALIARVGHVRSFAAFAAIAAAAVLTVPMVPMASALPVWAGLRCLIGFCMAAQFMTIESWINARTENRQRGRVIGLYQAATFVAISSAQLMVGFGDVTAPTLFSVVAMLYALSLVPLALTRIEPPSLATPARLSLPRLLAVSPLAVAMAFGSGLINTAYLFMGPVFATRIGMDPISVGRFMAIGMLSGLVMQWPLGWLSDHLDRRIVLTLISFGSAAASAGLGLAGLFAPPALFALAAAFGGFSFALYAQGVAHANDYAAHNERVAVSAGLLLAHGLGAILSPAAAGMTMDASGPAALFGYTAAMAAGLGVFCVVRMGKRAPKPVAEQTPFAPVPATTPVVAQLDPRAEPPMGSPAREPN